MLPWSVVYVYAEFNNYWHVSILLHPKHQIPKIHSMVYVHYLQFQFDIRNCIRRLWEGQKLRKQDSKGTLQVTVDGPSLRLTQTVWRQKYYTIALSPLLTPLQQHLWNTQNNVIIISVNSYTKYPKRHSKWGINILYILNSHLT